MKRSATVVLVTMGLGALGIAGCGRKPDCQKEPDRQECRQSDNGAWGATGSHAYVGGYSGSGVAYGGSTPRASTGSVSEGVSSFSGAGEAATARGGFGEAGGAHASFGGAHAGGGE